MKRLLLDTHVLLWWLDDNSSLGSKAKASITDGTMKSISVRQPPGKFLSKKPLES